MKLYVCTHIIDYTSLLCGVCLLQSYFLYMYNESLEALRDTQLLTLLFSWTLLSALLHLLWYARERLYLSILLHGKVSIYKKKYMLTWFDIFYIVRTTLVSTLMIVLMVQNKFIHFTPLNEIHLRFSEVFAFYAMVLLKDITLVITHRAMHKIPFLYKIHKTHHGVAHNSSFQLAFVIDFVDLFIEDACAPLIYFAFCYAIGARMSINIIAYHMYVLFNGGLHSVNPYTALFFNPFLDWIFRANVAHQIHHVVQTKNFSFVPFHHIFQNHRLSDMREYDKIMKTKFFQ